MCPAEAFLPRDEATGPSPAQRVIGAAIATSKPAGREFALGTADAGLPALPQRLSPGAASPRDHGYAGQNARCRRWPTGIEATEACTATLPRAISAATPRAEQQWPGPVLDQRERSTQ